jgi:hypothetical protein
MRDRNSFHLMWNSEGKESSFFGGGKGKRKEEEKGGVNMRGESGKE